MCAVFPGAGTWQGTGKPHLGCFHSGENACLLAAVGTQLWVLICTSLCHRFLPLSSGEKHQGAVQSRPRGDQEVCPMVWFHDILASFYGMRGLYPGSKETRRLFKVPRGRCAEAHRSKSKWLSMAFLCHREGLLKLFLLRVQRHQRSAVLWWFICYEAPLKG